MAPAPRSPALPLDEHLCLALYTASRAMTSRYRPLLADLGLTYPQYLVMVLLWQEGDTSLGRVGERLDLESSTLSPVVKRLEAMGLVSRRRAEQDERSLLVSLTPKGDAMRGRARDVPQQICDATGLSADQQHDLVGQLHRLAAQLDGPLP